mmetsp:Transcript_9044/g.28841  ORF Transcript_9044/g.28841 Transcript_9044/m.28841 type:complete len:108 (-) Transcript_9044:280-603(-)
MHACTYNAHCHMASRLNSCCRRHDFGGRSSPFLACLPGWDQRQLCLRTVSTPRVLVLRSSYKRSYAIGSAFASPSPSPTRQRRKQLVLASDATNQHQISPFNGEGPR